jgi:hypothetical protein
MLNVRRYRGDDCDTDHCLAVAKLRERLAVSKEKNIILKEKDLISGAK